MTKNRENEGFKRGGVPSKYADLAAVVDGAREALKANGLAFSQDVTSSAEGVGVSTTLLHESGEERTSKTCWMPVVNKTPQGFGSAITYARRYSFTAALGIVTDDDDDGNSASAAGKNLPKPSGTEGLKGKLPPVSGKPETPYNVMWSAFKAAKLTDADQFKSLVAESTGKTKDWSADDVPKFKKMLAALTSPDGMDAP